MTNCFAYSKNGNLYLNMSMSQSASSKARLSEHIGEPGVKAERKGNSWTFSKWIFTGTLVSEKNEVILEGAAFSGLALSTFFESDNKAKENLAGSRVVSAMEAAFEQGITLPLVGAGAIFVGADFERIIFLPQKLTEQACAVLPYDKKSEINGFYLSPVLSGKSASRFTQAVIAYRLICKELPFTQQNETKRNEDILDNNFILVKNRIWAISPLLASSVDNALLKKGVVRDISNKKKASNKVSSIIMEDSQKKEIASSAYTRFPLGELYKELGLTEAGDIPADGNLQNIIRKSSVSREEFERECQAEHKRFTSRLNRTRWIRAHHGLMTALYITIATAVAVCIFLVSTKLSRPTTKGLTDKQTVEMFYSAINNMEIVPLTECSKGKRAREIADFLSVYYVTARSRQTNEYNYRVVSPAEWMSFNNGGKFQMYGLSNFYIGTTKSNLFFTAPLVKSFPKPVSDNVIVKENSKRQLEASYYFLYNDEESIYIIKKTDTLFLTYKKNKWTITNIEQEEEELPTISTEEFTKDYLHCYEQNSLNAVKTAEALREKYEWLPLGSEILQGEEKIKQQYKD